LDSSWDPLRFASVKMLKYRRRRHNGCHPSEQPNTTITICHPPKDLSRTYRTVWNNNEGSARDRCTQQSQQSRAMALCAADLGWCCVRLSAQIEDDGNRRARAASEGDAKWFCGMLSVHIFPTYRAVVINLYLKYVQI
jgi:hypothetical protein